MAYNENAYNEILAKLPFGFTLYIEYDNGDGTDGEIVCYSRELCARKYLELNKPFKEIIYDDAKQGGTVTAVKEFKIDQERIDEKNESALRGLLQMYPVE